MRRPTAAATKTTKTTKIPTTNRFLRDLRDLRDLRELCGRCRRRVVQMRRPTAAATRTTKTTKITKAKCFLRVLCELCGLGGRSRGPLQYMSLLIESDGPVARITLNRPEVRNAFNEELIAELTAWAGSVTAGGAVRVAVLSGAGPVFCAGADLTWM